MKKDTIAAIATAMSNSGIGIVRISGEESSRSLIRYTKIGQKKYYQKRTVIRFIMGISMMVKN